MEILRAVSQQITGPIRGCSVTACDSCKSKTLILAEITGCTEQLDVSCEDTPR